MQKIRSKETVEHGLRAAREEAMVRDRKGLGLKCMPKHKRKYAIEGSAGSRHRQPG